MSLFNTQNAAQFAFNPLQKQIVSLYNVDRTQGLPVPECEGNYLYVDQADYPVIISFVNAATNVFQSYVARNGLMVKAPFKGIFLTHPLLNPGSGNVQQPKLILITGKNDATIENDLAAPFASMPTSARTLGNTALSQIFAVYMPPGTRRIEKLEFNFAGTTITAAQYQLTNNGNNSSGYGGILDQYGNSYAASVPLAGNLAIVNIATAPVQTWQMKGGEIMVPSYCDGIQITLTGTGLTAAGATYEATFS